MNYKEKYTDETGQKPYCWNKSGQYVKNGSYSDAYVGWLENKLTTSDVVNCLSCGKNHAELCGSCVSDIAQATGEQAQRSM